MEQISSALAELPPKLLPAARVGALEMKRGHLDQEAALVAVEG